ncbi:hypothetical protein K438DRAFT_2031547 [Mycena galopus ATCC 62051]|nr:hypothetical protein K438DRAFT_2031547 [Mycena galopus ATCC 62051]
MYSSLQGRRVVPQSQQAPAGLGSRTTLTDVLALVKNMDARIVAQEKKLHAQEQQILLLERDNAELWQEIHRLKGPRFPFEIFSAIILSTGEKPFLKTCSLVSRGWMCVTRGPLFERIQHNAMWWLTRDPLPILKNEHCTIFPYVQNIEIYGSTDDGSERPPMAKIGWLDDFLCLLPKFVALRCLGLLSLDAWHLEIVQCAMQPSIRSNIKNLEMGVEARWISECAAFISTFPALESLSVFHSWSADSGDEDPQLSKPLVSPPSTIKKLSFGNTVSFGNSDSNVNSALLNWFVDLHSGIIDSIYPGNLPCTHPAEFQRFLTRFGATLSRIVFMIQGQTGAVKFLNAKYCAALSHLKTIQLDFSGPHSSFDDSFLWTIEWLPKILASLPPSIEEIVLCMMTNYGYATERAPLKDKIGAIDWSHLDRSLTGTQYPLLRILKIKMSPSAADILGNSWPKLLPICARKGILGAETLN